MGQAGNKVNKWKDGLAGRQIVAGPDGCMNVEYICHEKVVYPQENWTIMLVPSCPEICLLYTVSKADTKFDCLGHEKYITQKKKKNMSNVTETMLFKLCIGPS